MFQGCCRFHTSSFLMKYLCGLSGAPRSAENNRSLCDPVAPSLRITLNPPHRIGLPFNKVLKYHVSSRPPLSPAIAVPHGASMHIKRKRPAVGGPLSPPNLRTSYRSGSSIFILCRFMALKAIPSTTVARASIASTVSNLVICSPVAGRGSLPPAPGVAVAPGCPPAGATSANGVLVP
jgi:hypothetical protein